MTGTKRASGTMVSDTNDVDLLAGLTLDTTAAAASPLYGSAVAVDKPGDVAFVLTTATVAGTAPVLTVVVQQSDSSNFYTTDTALTVSTTTAGVAPVDEVQIITPGGTITGGDYTITYAGQTTSAIAFDANAATITTALDALSNLAPGDCVATGGPVSSGVVTLTFGGTLAGTNVAQVTCDAAGLTGVAPTLTPSTTTAGVVAVNEVQRITPTTAPPNGGTFTITWEGQTTSALAYNASAATIQTAMEALSNIGVGECVCAGGPINTAFVSFTFSGALGGANQDAMTLTLTGLTSDPDVFTLNTFVSTGTGEDTEVYSGVAHVNKKYVRAKVTVADGGTVDADYTGTTLYVRQPHWHRTGDSTERTIV